MSFHREVVMMHRIALVTGGNQGLGFETARQLGEQGLTVLVSARDEHKARGAVAELEKTRNSGRSGERASPSWVPLQLDVTDSASIGRAAEWISKTYGRLDVLVNNAGIMHKDWHAPVSRISLAEVRSIFDTNFFGLVELTLALLPLLRKSESGRIVNVSSICGSLAEHADPNSPIYGMTTLGYNASKAAVNMFTVNLAVELKTTTVKVNAAHPGWVRTNMGGPDAPLTPREGAETIVWLATLGPEGPSGGHFHGRQTMRW